MPSVLTKENAAIFRQKVNATIRCYIEAQDSVFKFTFLKVLGLKRIDPAMAAAKTGKLKAQVQSMLDEVRKLNLEAGDPLHEFFITMRPYLRNLHTAMTFFIDFCGSMTAAQTDKHSRYWKERYKKDLEKFQQKETDYLAIGNELKQRWKKLAEKTMSK